MARKRKRYEKINPTVVLILLIIILLLFIASVFLDSMQNSNNASEATNAHSQGSITHSSSELGEIEYHFIDVGQGDSTLIRTPEGDILIDAGENSAEDELKAYLDLQGVEVLYYAIFTHPDSDHIGGADMVLEEYEVLNVIKPDFEKTTKVYKAMMDAIAAEGCKVYNALPGETYSLGEFDMFIFGPDPANKELDSNNSSIVIKATWGETTAMLTGDAEKPAEEMPEEGGEGEEISAEAFAKTLANPMFALFARGRSGGIEEGVRDFEKMLMDGRSTLTEEEIMKMTPGACGSYLGNALSERQRKIARDAGMSYREYYEIIRTIPTKTK
jgi:beta-lactamase superfamily II metal-dependent hydrolase